MGLRKTEEGFLQVDDLADACVFIISQEEDKIDENIQQDAIISMWVPGIDYSIAEVAELISEIVGYDGEVVFDSSKPDGTPRKLLDSLLNGLGWSSAIDLENGLSDTYEWYCSNIHSLRK